MIISLPEHQPEINKDVAFIADNATIAGWVELQSQVSIWFQAVLRAEYASITVGEGTNIQDGCVCHTDPGQPLNIGKSVTVGHRAVLHGCTIGDYSLIGINSLILNKAVIGRYCLIGANTLITEGMEIADYSLVLGSPGKVVRQLTEKEKQLLKKAAKGYVEKSAMYNDTKQ